MTTEDSISKEYYGLLLEAGQCNDNQLSGAYFQLRQLLERICQQQMEGVSLQLTDLSARITFLASKLHLSTSSQHRLHTFRLTSNGVLNNERIPQREELLRNIKTLAFLVQLITQVAIPDELKNILPQADAVFHATPLAIERVKQMRVSFLRKDDQFLYVQPADHVPEQPLRVRYGLKDVNEEFNDTVEALWEHAQLNLLDVGVDAEGILTPMFIVLEPDYLMDVSALAECFKAYGHHPANYLMARLSPQENTVPLLVGNIANAFLDAWIYNDHPDYQQSMKDAFRQYPVRISACRDLQQTEKARQFSTDCKLHFGNIQQTVCQTFNESGYQLDKEDAVLEPSYICEALGMQGRLDYMQRDMSSFIEMKSGKADEYTMPGHILPQENNRVQMQLYQAMLEYSMGVDHNQGKAYLLYTRYPLLYPARPSWAMVRRVINLRNRIVATEYQVQAQNDEAFTAKVLAQINPQTLNEKQLDNRLWRDFLSPQIAAFQHSLQSLTPLEKSYFYTVYSFITRELYISKTGGSSDYEGRKGQAMQWLGTYSEKLEAGEIVADLQIMENHADDIANPYIVLNGHFNAILPNFRPGDAVVLYRRDNPKANVSNQMLFKGSIEEINPDGSWKIALRQPQRNPRVLPLDSLYAFEHDFMDTSYRSMFQGLGLFLQATRHRRDLLLGQALPTHQSQYDEAIAQAADDFQRITLKALAANDYFLLVGPPGTGKTSLALRSMVEAFLQQDKQLLLLSYTNRAVDEICKMLTKAGVTYIRIGSRATCAEAYHHRLMDEVMSDCETRQQVVNRLHACHVIVGTVSTLSIHTSIFNIKTFDAALIDEATQILEPQLLGLLCMKDAEGTHDAIRKFILIGDHKQLPAVVQQPTEASEVQSEALRQIGLTNLKDSLFERLYRNLNTLADQSPYYLDMLTRQGRMHPEVARFANEAFYEGKLIPVGLPHQLESFEQIQCSLSGVASDKDTGIDLFNGQFNRVAFFASVPAPAMSSHKTNSLEAQIAAQLAREVYQRCPAGTFNPQYTLGIITPYRSQIALIRQEIAKLQIEALQEITIDTVERYQGSERDVIIYSFCVNRPWQLRQLSNLTVDNGHLIDRKLNVALTRARKQLCLIGVPHLLRQNPIYNQLMESVRSTS